jgi:hypothetical protein
MIYVLLALFAVFAVLIPTILLVPIRLRLILNDHTRTVSLGWLVIQLGRDLKERTFALYLGGRVVLRRQAGTAQKREPKKEKTGEDKVSKKSKFNLADLWKERDLIEKIIQTGLRLVWDVFKSIRWNKLLLEVDVSTPDPALTGFLYGELCAVKYSAEYVFPRARIGVRSDFVEELPRVSGESVFSLRPASMIWPLVKAFLAVPKIRTVKLLIRRKRR